MGTTRVVTVCLAGVAALCLWSPAAAGARSGELQETVADRFGVGRSVTTYRSESGAEDVQRALAEAEAGPSEVAVVLFRFPGDPAVPWSPEETRSKVFTTATSANAFFDEESYGEISLTGRLRPDGDVFGWYTLDAAPSGCPYLDWDDEADQLAADAGVDLSSYRHVIYAFPHRGSCAWAGIADVGGSRINLNGNVGSRTIAHEIGHNLGLQHAGSWTCTSGGVRVQIGDDCTTSEYGDPFDAMGSAYRHNNGWNLAQLDVLAPVNVATVATSGTYSLRSALSPTAEPTALRIARTWAPGDGTVSSWYYLEVRETGGIFENVVDATTSGVSVRVVQEGWSPETLLLDANPVTFSFADAPLGVGQTFDGGPVQVRALSAGAGQASVEIDVDTEPPSAPSDLQATVDANGVRLSWAGSDNVGVDRYFVYRDGELLGSDDTPTYLDTRSPAGDHAYVVVAEDEYRNQSDPSEPLAVPVPAVSGPTCANGKCKLAFRYSGAPETWTVPPGVDGASLTVEGARGGGAGGGPERAGGAGARIWATLEPLTPGQEVEVSVGGHGTPYSEGGAGGFNGGAGGGLGGGGGGYTTVELDSALAVLAAGGGGGGLDGVNGTLWTIAGRGGAGSGDGAAGTRGAQTTAHGATLRGGTGGAAGGTGGAAGEGGLVLGTSDCPGGADAGVSGAPGDSFTGGGGVAGAGGGGGGGHVGGGQGGGPAGDECGIRAASGGGGGGSSFVAPGRLEDFETSSGDDGWVSIQYDDPAGPPPPPEPGPPDVPQEPPQHPQDPPNEPKSPPDNQEKPRTDTDAPLTIELSSSAERSLRELLRTGELVVVAKVSEAAKLVLTGRAKLRVRSGEREVAKFVTVFRRKTVGFATAGERKVTLVLSRSGREALGRLAAVQLAIAGQATDAAGESALKRVTLTLQPD